MADDPMSLAQEFAALNEATRKAHEAIADMRTERRLLAEAIAEARTLLAGEIQEQMVAEVTRQLDTLGEANKKAMAESVAKVSSEIDRYLALALGQTEAQRLAGHVSIPEIFARRKAADRG